MKFTVSLKKNHEFRRLYSKGKSAANPLCVVYCRKNGCGVSRLGITVSTKIGNAVCRNRIRRRLKEIYRTNEHRFSQGFDIVVVARVKSKSSAYDALEKDFLRLLKRLQLIREPL